jgi:hypothetical protein
MTLEEVRRFAMSLPEVTEEPHFDKSSFRVRGKIFATAPTDGEHLHVFVDEHETLASVAEDPRRIRGVVVGQAPYRCASKPAVRLSAEGLRTARRGVAPESAERALCDA